MPIGRLQSRCQAPLCPERGAMEVSVCGLAAAHCWQRQGATTPVLERPFRHEDNVHYALTPRVVVGPGEKVHASCTDFNDETYSAGFGISLVQSCATTSR